MSTSVDEKMPVSSNVFLVISAVLSLTNAVKVSVYYEALCPDSVRFIALQLYPHYEELAKYVDLDLVPYGKAAHSESNGTWEFLCQHGPSECKGNKYQSCALSLRNGSETDVKFVNCVMRSRRPSQLFSVQMCAVKFDLDIERIKTCSSSSEGDELLAANGDKTPPIAFVPTVIYDDMFDQVAQDQSLEDFVAVVCSKIDDPKPPICENKSLPKVRSWRLF